LALTEDIVSKDWFGRKGIAKKLYRVQAFTGTKVASRIKIALRINIEFFAMPFLPNCHLGACEGLDPV
jgi:hypothetical protein